VQVLPIYRSCMTSVAVSVERPRDCVHTKFTRTCICLAFSYQNKHITHSQNVPINSHYTHTQLSLLKAYVRLYCIIISHQVNQPLTN